jgi:hypothetical protein
LDKADATTSQDLLGQKVLISGHFDEPVLVEAVRPLSAGVELRVRRASGHLEETVLSEPEFQALVAAQAAPVTDLTPVNPDHLRLLVESTRIRLAYAHDRQFAVSLSGIRTLPHQAVDAPTRFFVLWRYAYRAAPVDAGEAIVFAYPQGVELDGPRSLSHGARALVEKQKSKYRLRDFTERGEDDKLGLPLADGSPAPLIDVLHRVLWLMENRVVELGEFLDQAQPDFDRVRVVAQALAGHALAGNGEGGGKALVAARGAEAAALRKLTTNWRTLIETRRGELL